MFKTLLNGFLLLLIQPSVAELQLAPLFRDGAVLQRGKAVPVWGRADPSAEVVVSFGGQSRTARADGRGRWQVNLEPMSASAEGRVLKVISNGAPPIELRDVVVGEVWLGSGQLSMQWSISQCSKKEQEEAAGLVPLLRLFDVPRTVQHARQETVKGSWKPATPDNAKTFSAIAFFFGKQIAAELKIPVGIIHSSWGGSRIEPWWAEEGLEGIEKLAQTREFRLARSPGFPEYDQPLRKFLGEVGPWATAATKALDTGIAVPPMPSVPPLLKLGPDQETGTYQAMIHPLVPYALRGFIWYQGESNNGDGMLYATKQQALIAGWRKQFLDPNAPFLFVQLAPHNYGDHRVFDLPRMWWAQQETLKIPHTGMAVTNDIGTIRGLQSSNKSEIAKRLALWALVDTYGKKNIVKSGPLFSGYKVTPSGIEVRFKYTGSGLGTRDRKPPTWFEVAADDGVFKAATAKISADKQSILLTCQAIPHPTRARFAWSQLAEPNLTNFEGLPAAAFHTHWPEDFALGTKVSEGKPYESSHPNTRNWHKGLTDGVWGNTSPNCFSTAGGAVFPKTVTIDLGKIQKLHAIVYGTPNVGSTKTVAVSVSEDGVNFTEVGRNDFPPKKASRAEARFKPRSARFVRATFHGNHPKQDDYDGSCGLLSEMEAYCP